MGAAGDGVPLPLGHGARLQPGHSVAEGEEVPGRAGVSAKGSCHLFRHASATALLEGGADVRFVQEFLGHAKLEATEVYTHVTLTKLKAVYEACHPGARPAAAAPAPVPTAVEVLEALEEEGGGEDEEGELQE